MILVVVYRFVFLFFGIKFLGFLVKFKVGFEFVFGGVRGETVLLWF